MLFRSNEIPMGFDFCFNPFKPSLNTPCKAVSGAITGDTTGAIIGALKDHLIKTIVGRDVDDFEELIQAVNGCIVKNTSAKAAVDMALYDLYGQLYKLPVYKLFGASAWRTGTPAIWVPTIAGSMSNAARSWKPLAENRKFWMMARPRLPVPSTIRVWPRLMPRISPISSFRLSTL